ncbi:MAG: MotA/TolQ/ExbB proton channel family protein [Spirochaetaceae bacterium]|nr:MotA/TolQ/ExbB proton channel family protein [Spirochaetaceae bacterium]
MDIIQKGGPIMVVIIFLSVVAVVVIIERMLYFRRNRVDEEKLLSRLKSRLQERHFDEALAICEANPSPISSLVSVGIQHRHQPNRVVREIIMDAANVEIPKQERFLPTLGTIAHVAPLLGLLGTVTGNISAFGVLGEAGAVADSSQLALGISEALLTTAAGMIVGIPVIMFYNYLVSKANNTIVRLENRVSELVLLLGVQGE